MHYPGTYLARGYNRLTTPIAGREVENEVLVNFPNWLVLTFRCEGEDWFDERKVRLHSYCQELDLRRAVLLRKICFEDARGRRSTLTERRLVSMADMHLAALELTLTDAPDETAVPRYARIEHVEYRIGDATDIVEFRDKLEKALGGGRRGARRWGSTASLAWT